MKAQVSQIVNMVTINWNTESPTKGGNVDKLFSQTKKYLLLTKNGS